MLVMLPHIIVGSAALIRIGIILVAMLAPLTKIILGVGNAVATSTTATICAVLRMVRVTWVLVIHVAMLVPLDVVAILL
jgi:hypothetical protein